MCDVEEPPKISKIKTSSLKEDADDGQEEWLSEDMLSDDDNHGAEPDKTDSSHVTSQEDLDEMFLDETMLSAEHSMDSQNMSQTSQGDVNQEQVTSQDNMEAKEPVAESIEQTLNDLEDHNQDSRDKQTTSQQPGKSDGNDTDDLLRLLGDNDDKSKKKVLVKTKEKKGVNRRLKDKPLGANDGDSSDDDEYIFDGAVVQKLRVARSALARKPAARAEPEDFDVGDDDADCSSDETSTLQNIFAMKNVKNSAKNTSQSSRLNERQVKKVVKIRDSVLETSKSLAPKRTGNVDITRSANKGQVRTIVRQRIRNPSKERIEKRPQQFDNEHDEIINEEEFMEEEDFDLDEDFADNSDVETGRSGQQIMRPERMDEEVPTDMESDSDSDAAYDIYDEMPSPESEDRDGWFTLDIRAERACDYLPLLGDKAYELLLSEKRRVSERLARLRRGAARLARPARRRALRLERAGARLRSLDDVLKAS